MSGSGRWSDLAARLGSAVVLVAVGAISTAIGGDFFHVFIALTCGAMIWELVRMLDSTRPRLAVQLGLLSGAAILLSIYLPPLYVLPVLLAPALTGAGQLTAHRGIYAGFVALVSLAGYEMMILRDEVGTAWLLWLILVVVASDVAGYFAGKAIGGPKFWPQISPNKTWSGTVAGWIGGGLVGLVVALSLQTSLALVPFSAVVALAAQMGDIAESAVKRRMGVKDSSALIPGHGGLLDRFDGMLGAATFVLLIGPFVGFSSGPL